MEQTINVGALLSPPDILQFKRVLCVQPHPDDNEIGMGGTIAVLAQNGCEVHYLTTTKSEMGGGILDTTTDELAIIRREEAQAAGRLLGATGFHFFDYGDGTLSDVPKLSEEIADVIRQVKPDIIFCPDPWLPYEAHWDHIVTGQAVSNAMVMSGLVMKKLPSGADPWIVSAIAYYFTANPNTVIDITNTFEQKFEAIALHKSQIDEKTLAMFRIYFTMKGQELALDKGFSLGEGFKVLGKLHTHCFVDAYKI